MQKAVFRLGGAAIAALLALLTATSLEAAETSGVRPVAEELGQRAAAASPEGQQQQGGLSDSAVRVLLTYAFSIIPDSQNGADGKSIKVDKSDPNVFLIPDADARRIIRAATRSAYADACDLPDLARENYNALMRSEQAKKVWSDKQLMMINALHMFSASYFSGNAKISAAPDEETAPGEASTTAPKGAEPVQEAGGSEIVTPKKPPCPPEQKQKVINSINAYVQSAKAATPPPSPAAPAASGAN